jgi:hypothetical protein
MRTLYPGKPRPLPKYSAPIGGVIEVTLLPSGCITLIDEADKPLVEDGRWGISKKQDGAIYVIRSTPGGGPQIFMHRQILNAPADMEVDHINRCGLDNRRSNIRLCTPQQNCRNIGPREGRKFKGVYLIAGGKYRSNIQDGRARITIGLFATDIEAAVAYDEAARRLFGEFAYLNFPNGVSQ